jgi:hypothetical protein
MRAVNEVRRHCEVTRPASLTFLHVAVNDSSIDALSHWAPDQGNRYWKTVGSSSVTSAN